MEEIKNQKSKSPIEKLAPLVLILGVVILGYFAFSKLQTSSVDSGNVQTGSTQIAPVEVDTNFLMTNAFTVLKFIPDSAIFNEPTGTIDSGRDDPFAPVK